MGTISPLGNDVQTLWENIMAGNSGIKQLNDAAFQNINTTLAGTAMPFRAEDYLSSKEIKRYDRFTQFGYASAMQALEQSELDLEQVDKERIVIYVGAGAGGIQPLLTNLSTMLDKAASHVSPFTIPLSINNMASRSIAIKTGFTGPSLATVSA